MNNPHVVEIAEQLEPKKPWERQENEPARWYMRFRRYLATGHTRSINAVFEAERREKAGKSSNKAGETWYHAAKLYQWEARAAAYDDAQLEQKAQTMRQIAARSPFVSRPYRIAQLNSMADGLARLLEFGQEPEVFLPCCKLLQTLMHDIAAEVEAWDIPLDASCDAAALEAYHAKGRRLADIEDERTLDQEASLDALMQKVGLLHEQVAVARAAKRISKL